MRANIIMPKLGMTMQSGVVTAWIKHNGDTVKAGETVATIESDKIANDVQAPKDGVFHPTAELDTEIPCAESIGYIEY